MKKKAPGLAKATGFIEIIMGTILIMLSITMINEGEPTQGYILLIPGIVFWFFGIMIFRFSRGAWFGNFIMLILAKTGIIYLLYELVKEYGGWDMKGEQYLLFGLLAILVMLLVFILALKKHLE